MKLLLSHVIIITKVYLGTLTIGRATRGNRCSRCLYVASCVRRSAFFCVWLIDKYLAGEYLSSLIPFRGRFALSPESTRLVTVRRCAFVLNPLVAVLNGTNDCCFAIFNEDPFTHLTVPYHIYTGRITGDWFHITFVNFSKQLHQFWNCLQFNIT